MEQIDGYRDLHSEAYNLEGNEMSSSKLVHSLTPAATLITDG